MSSLNVPFKCSQTHEPQNRLFALDKPQKNPSEPLKLISHSQRETQDHISVELSLLMYPSIDFETPDLPLN